MATTNGERLKAYKSKMKAAGFRRLSIWVHPDLVAELRRRHRAGECGGRTLERLLLGEARLRPSYWERAEKARRALVEKSDGGDPRGKLESLD